MSEVTSAGLIEIFDAIARAIERQKDHLSELDGAIGDADHGVTMDMGFAAVTKALAGLGPDVEPTQVFNTAAKSFLNAVGASSGPLYATAFMRAGAAVKGKTSLDRDAMVAAVVAMAQGIQDRGKAERGEKTMVDAWLPAAEAIRAAASKGEPLQACLNAAEVAAQAGAEATRSMIATKGRASRLGERVIGHVDPGAASAAVILGAMADSLTALSPPH